MASAKLMATKPDVLLTLTHIEAMWLKEQLQNPLHGDNPETEAAIDNTMRRELFTALRIA